MGVYFSTNTFLCHPLFRCGSISVTNLFPLSILTLLSYSFFDKKFHNEILLGNKFLVYPCHFYVQWFFQQCNQLPVLLSLASTTRDRNRNVNNQRLKSGISGNENSSTGQKSDKTLGMGDVVKFAIMGRQIYVHIFSGAKRPLEINLSLRYDSELSIYRISEHLLSTKNTRYLTRVNLIFVVFSTKSPSIFNKISQTSLTRNSTKMFHFTAFGLTASFATKELIFDCIYLME